MCDDGCCLSRETALLAWRAVSDAVNRAVQRDGTAAISPPVQRALTELAAAAGSATGTKDAGPARSVAPSGPVEYIDVATAAQRLGITERAVRKRCASGRLPAQRLGGGSWAIEWRGNE